MIDAIRDPRVSVSPKSELTELTVGSFCLGLALAAVFSVLNTYLGLGAGYFIPTAIPAAALSVFILQWLLKSGSSLEHNTVQTLAATGQSLTASLVITLPALLVSHAWPDVELTTALWIGLSGGVIGIALTVALRSTASRGQPFPEASACVQILESAERGSIRALTLPFLLAGSYQFAAKGLRLLPSYWEIAGKRGLYWYAGAELSPALVGIGALMGERYATFAFLGGIATWFLTLSGVIAVPNTEGPALAWIWEQWHNQGRYLGIGAIGVTALSIAVSSWALFFKRIAQEPGRQKEDNHISRAALALLAGVAAVIVLCLLWGISDSIGLALSLTLALFALATWLVPAAIQITATLGFSQMALFPFLAIAVVTAGTLLRALGFEESHATLATLLMVATVVGVLVATTAETTQCFYVGQRVGATPWLQQVLKLLAILVPAIITPLTLMAVHHAQGIGTGQPQAIRVPQATLLFSIAHKVTASASLPWETVALGAAIALLFLILERAAEGRNALGLSGIALATGMYLPLSVTTPLFVGGLVGWGIRRSGSPKAPLLAAGLITGEAFALMVVGAMALFR